MGVRGLLDYVSKTPESRQRVNLREAAKELREKSGKEPKLLCDYYSILYWLLSSCDHALIKCGEQSPYSIMYGGDLNRYSSAIRSFLDALRGLGVEPVFFVDGPPGSSMEEFPSRLPKWQARYLQKLERCADIQHVCDGNQNFLSVHWMLWEAASLQAVSALCSAGVEVVYCLGEADPRILKYHRSHGDESLGILSSDTDFVIAPGSVLYHTSFFEKDLVLELVSGTFDSLPDMTCDVITPHTVATSLGITEVQLLDLSVLCGNDFTREMNFDLSPWAVLGLRNSKVEVIAAWLQTEATPLLENKEMSVFFDEHPNYKAAIEHSHRAYCGGAEAKGGIRSPRNSALTRYVEEEVQSGRMSSSLLSVVNGVYWRTVVIGPITLGQPSFSDHTLSLRRCVYALFGLQHVREYGRTSSQTFTETRVNLGAHFADIDSTQILRTIRNFSVNSKLAILFHLVAGIMKLRYSFDISCLLSQGSLYNVNLEGEISSKAVLICASLLLVHQANARLRPSPRISSCDVDAILVTCLLLAANVPPCHSSTLPKTRAVTVAMWFSHVLEQVYMAASVIGLSASLDPPGSIFYPLAFVPFHLASAVENEDSVESVFGSNISEALAIFSIVIGLKPVLNLRAAILNQQHSLDFQDFLRLFESSLEQVVAMKESLTPKHGLCSLPPSKIDIGFETERREDNERETSILSDAPELELDMDFTASTADSIDRDVSSEAVAECDELSSIQEYVISEEHLYLSCESQKEETQVEQGGSCPPEVVERSSTTNSRELLRAMEKEEEGMEEGLVGKGERVASSDGTPRVLDAHIPEAVKSSQPAGDHDLPVVEHREKILSLISSHQVSKCLIIGYICCV